MKLLLTYLLLVVSFYGNSQKLDASISSEEITVGESTTITYSVKSKLSDTLLFIPKVESIPARKINGQELSTEGASFEILKSFTDTTINNQHQNWSGKYTITVWDSGQYIIQGPKIHINDSTFTFNKIYVNATLIADVDSVDIFDIRENFTEIPPRPFSFKRFLKSNWWWLSIIVILTIIFFFIRKNKNDIPVIEDKIVSLKQRTIFAIEALEDSKLWEKEKLKEHFVELSYILRAYLTARYSVSLLERTTKQTKLLLTEKGLNDDTIDVIIRILSQSDMVKFAKSKPDTVAILRISTLAKQVVAETSPLEFDNVE